MSLSPDIACRACQIGGGVVDYGCVDCCVRLLGRLPNKALVAGHIRSMENFNAEVPGFSERLAEAWKKFVAKRSSGVVG